MSAPLPGGRRCTKVTPCPAPVRCRSSAGSHATNRNWLRRDLAAGIAVTALIVSKDLGYAEIAGVPVQNGLYAAAAGAIVYALFCTSRQISTGPSSSLAAVAGGAVIATGIAGDQAPQLVAAIAGPIASHVFDLGAHGVALVGDVPRGLPMPELHDLDLVRQGAATVALAASALVLIGSPRPPVMPARSPPRHRYRIDVDQAAARDRARRGPRSWPRSRSTWTCAAPRSGWPPSSRQVLSVLGADGFVDRLGADHIHPSVNCALKAQLDARAA